MRDGEGRSAASVRSVSTDKKAVKGGGLCLALKGARADDTYSVKFEANGNSKTIENVSLPKTWACNYASGSDELISSSRSSMDWMGGCSSTNPFTSVTGGNGKVTVVSSENQSITITEPFEGTATVTGQYCNQDYVGFSYSLTISIPGYIAPTYAVTLKANMPDAGNWTAKAGSATTFSALPLEGVAVGSQVSLKYAGTNQVKSVAVRPADALDGKFSVSATKQVYFSQGSLQYVGTEWSFHTNQYDVIGTTQSDGNRDLFGWGTGDAPNKVSTNDADYNTWTDWGDNMGPGWHTLTIAEWMYMFNNHTYGFATVNGVTGTIVLPDGCTLTINTSLNSYDNNTIDAATWQSTYAPEGVLFLPAHGFRDGTTINQLQQSAYCWSSTTAANNKRSGIIFAISGSRVFTTYQDYNGHLGLAVRLVNDVVDVTSAGANAWTFTMPACDVELEPEYIRATLTAEPAAAEDVVEGTDAALLTAGTSAEGTIFYALGQSDTEAPTDGWSADVPTAQGLTQGTYYVWYKVVGDAQHIDSEPQCIEVTVVEAPATYTVAMKEGTTDAESWTIAPAEATTTGVAAGTTVTATYSGAKKVKSVRAKMAAAANVPVESITLNKTATEITVGQKETLTATVLPDNATDKSVTWSSGNKGVATVNAETGEVTAVAPGTATITATANDGSQVQCSCTVTVTVIWDSSNITPFEVYGTEGSYTNQGIKLSCNADNVQARWENGIQFNGNEPGGFTFTAPSGKKFTKIEMTVSNGAGWSSYSLGTGWVYDRNTKKVTWTGAAASTVDLLKEGTGDPEEPIYTPGPVTSIVFTLE